MKIHRFGKTNGGNADFIKKSLNNSIPIPHTPEFTWSWHVDKKRLALLQALAVQTTTVVHQSTTDGDHSYTFAGTLADGTVFSVPTAAFTASGNTAAQIAAGLEAIVETARATTLALVLSGESNSSATNTFVFLPGVVATVTETRPGGTAATVGRTFSTVVTPASRVGGKAVMPDFPEDVIRSRPQLVKRTAVAGVTTPTIVVGDANAANGLITSSALTGTGRVVTAGAAEFADVEEAAFIPQVTIGSVTTPLTSVTAGEFRVDIRVKGQIPI
jgi:hypothetical protein